MNSLSRLPQRRLTALFLFLASLSQPAQSAVNDVFPTDYATLPAGATVVSVYGYHRHSEGPYAQGQKQMDGKLDVPIAALRVLGFTKLGDMTFAPMVIVSWAAIKAAPSALSNQIGPDAYGYGDLRLGGTLWLIDDAQKQEYLGLTVTAILPTGSYDSKRALNIGENRWRLLLGGGWIKPLSERVILEVWPEVVFYGDNNDFLGQNTLAQRQTYALTGTLRYHFTPAFQVFGSAQLNRGGATTIGQVDQQNPANNTRVSLGASYFTFGNQMWTLRYSRDTHIENGFKTADELALRCLVFF